MKKNDVLTVDIIDNGINLEGIAKIEGIPCFIPNTIEGEIASIKILKVNTSTSFGKVENIIKASKFRKEVDCEVYGKCGGCDGLHIDYDKLLDIKRETTINTLNKQGIDTNCVGHIHGMGNPYNYRNKIQYPVRMQKDSAVIGMYAKMSHSVIQNNGCLIQDSIVDVIAKRIFKLLVLQGFTAYDETSCTGDIKHIMVRRGVHTKDIMCVIVSSENIAEKINKTNIIADLIKEYPSIKSILLNINIKNTNIILSDKNMLLFGEDKITEKIGEYLFNISVNSFFQVNTVQAEVLYHILQDNLKLKKTDIVLELYSGVGTIGIILSSKVKKVLAIEIIPEAVNMAKENVKLNNVSNVECVLGDSTEQIRALKEKGETFDVVIVDPPRKGLEREGVETLLKLELKKIGYISCNPATLARDLKLLKEKYNIDSIELIDMFPWTSHVESIVVLSLKNFLE